jgi:hypothetical protein
MNKNYKEIYAFAESLLDLSEAYFDKLSAFEARLKTVLDPREAEDITRRIDQNEMTIDELMGILEPINESKETKEDSPEVLEAIGEVIPGTHGVRTTGDHDDGHLKYEPLKLEANEGGAKGAEEMLSTEDAIYVTSWAAYNEGRPVGGWLMLKDLIDMIPEERIDAYKKLGLEPYGRDEELVVHDFDDYSGVGYYELLHEPHPETAVELYEELYILEDDEFLAFIGLKETQSNETALETLRNRQLGDWTVYNEDTMRDLAEDILESYIDVGNLDAIRDFIDEDMIRRDLEMDITYDEETGEPDFEVTQEVIDDFILSYSSADPYQLRDLRGYIDIDDYVRYISYDYGVFQYNGENYYLLEA